MSLCYARIKNKNKKNRRSLLRTQHCLFKWIHGECHLGASSQARNLLISGLTRSSGFKWMLSARGGGGSLTGARENSKTNHLQRSSESFFFFCFVFFLFSLIQLREEIKECNEDIPANFAVLNSQIQSRQKQLIYKDNWLHCLDYLHCSRQKIAYQSSTSSKDEVLKE